MPTVRPTVTPRATATPRPTVTPRPTATPLPATLRTPTQRKVPSLSGTTLTVHWNSVANASGFEIRHSTNNRRTWTGNRRLPKNPWFVGIAVGGYRGKTVCAQVRAVSTNLRFNTSAWGDLGCKAIPNPTPTATPVPVAQRLAMPAKVHAAPTANATGQVNLNWKRVANAGSYRVSWTVNGAAQPEIARTSSQLSAVVQAAAHRGKTVCAKVVAKSSNGRLFTDSSARNLGCVAVPKLTLARPTQRKVPSLSGTTLTVHWNSVANASGFEIRHSTNNRRTWTGNRQLPKNPWFVGIAVGDYRGKTVCVQARATSTGQGVNASSWGDLGCKAIPNPTPSVNERIESLVNEQGSEYAFARASVTGDWSAIAGGDPATWTSEEKRVFLEAAGFDIEPSEDPDRVEGVNSLLGAIPKWMLAEVFASGWKVQLQGDVRGLRSPRSLLTPVGASVTVGGSTEFALSNPQIGVGFTQTQVAEIEARIAMKLRVEAGKNRLQKLYKWVNRFRRTAEWINLNTSVDAGPVARLLERSRLLKATRGVGQATGLPFSVAWERFGGAQIKYSATLDPAQAARLDAGDISVLPNIWDRESFAIGNAVLIQGGPIEGSFMELSYKRLRAGNEIAEFRNLGFGVERLDETRFAIWSGPMQGVENDLRLGLSVVAVVSERAATVSGFSYAEIDTALPNGRAAYDDFVYGLKLPSTDSYGVRTSTVRRLTNVSELGINFDIDFYSASWIASAIETDVAVRSYANGTRELVTVYTRPESALQLEVPLLADNSADYRNLQMTFVLEDARRRPTIEGLAEIFGEQPPPGNGPVDIQFSLTGDHIEALRRMAVDWYASWPVPRSTINPLIFTEALADDDDLDEAIETILLAAERGVNMPTVIQDAVFAYDVIDLDWPGAAAVELQYNNKQYVLGD